MNKVTQRRIFRGTILPMKRNYATTLLIATAVIWLSAVAHLSAQQPAGPQATPKPEETEVWEPIPPVVTPGATCGAPPSDAIILFDGKNLDEWVMNKDKSPANWVVHGYQADMEAGPTYTGILYEEGIRGIMAERGQKVVWGSDGKKQVTGSVGDAAEIEASIKKGDWNDYVIIAQGNHLQQFVNGKQTIDVTDEDEAKRAMSGVLAFQLHAGSPMMAQFRNIRLKKL